MQHDHHRENYEHIKHKRQVGDCPGFEVIGEHNNDNNQQADFAGRDALSAIVGPYRRAYRFYGNGLLDKHRWQRTGLEFIDHVHNLFGAEAALDDTVCTDSGADKWSRNRHTIKQYAKRPFKVGSGQLSEHLSAEHIQ